MSQAGAAKRAHGTAWLTMLAARVAAFAGWRRYGCAAALGALRRALDKGIVAGIEWLCGDAEALPLTDGSVDAYTIAFGLRNVTGIDKALREARRVLKPGGRFLCMEFSRVVLPILDRLYERYSFAVVPAIGAAVTGDRQAYRYLVESIAIFPSQEELAERITGAGFDLVKYRNLSGGIAAIHSAWRV